MNLKLVTFSTNECTRGKIYVDDNLICNTFELPWLENEQNISCIPGGYYMIKMVKSPKYGYCYKIFDVPGRTDILIHKGNTVIDTKGCILPVSRFGMLLTRFGIKVAGLASRTAYVKLMTVLGDDVHDLIIERY